MRDYVAIATAYARDAVSAKPKRVYGKWIKLAAQRFLDDTLSVIEGRAEYTFDDWHANDVCDFVEKLPHIEGAWSSPTIVLHDSDVFFLVNLFGFRKPDGTRRFTMALKAIARKNAKSTLAAAIALYCQTCEDEIGPQIISAATTYSQANIVFSIAQRMAKMTSALRSAFGLRVQTRKIMSDENGGVFFPIHAKACSQDGLNPSVVILDEVHAHQDNDLLNVLRSAAGARSNPLFLYTTTEGYETPGPWPELRRFAERVLEGTKADHFFCVIYCVDEEDDDFDESAWPKANPLIEVNPHLLPELRKEAIEAREMPSKLSEFRIKRLNRRSSVARGWIRFPEWQACGGPTDLTWDVLRKAPCYGGLDLASVRDLASFRLVWDIDGELYTAGLRWVPREVVNAKVTTGMIPYQSWIASGHIKVIPGKVLDYDTMIQDIIDFASPFNVQEIGFDPWNASQVDQKLGKSFKMVSFAQGAKSYHPAMKAFEHYYIQGHFHHGGDPVLTWCAANLVVRLDVNLNMAPDKSHSNEKIDDMTALLMAVGRLVARPQEKKFQMFVMK